MGPTREIFSGEGQPSVCKSDIAGLTFRVLRSRSETESLLVSSNY